MLYYALGRVDGSKSKIENHTMSLLFIAPNRDLEVWKKALLEKDSNLDIEIWPKVENKERVTFAVCWNHPKNVLGNYPNLQVVSSLGAGVNHLLADEALPKKVRISRIVTPSLKNRLAEYLLNSVLNYRNHIPRYVDQKREGYWAQHSAVSKSDCTIGIMGMGEMGITAAQLFLLNGYNVVGWSKSKKEIEGITCYSESERDDFLAQTNILICLLPLTEKTEGILDLELFKKLKKPAYVINAGRGEHLVEEDLIYGIDTNALEGACLDVFEEEPLPSNHLFWNRPKIMITPHIAAITDPLEGAEIILENYKRALSGMALINEVIREKGY